MSFKNPHPSGIVFPDDKDSNRRPHFEQTITEPFAAVFDFKKLSTVGKYLGDDQSKKDQNRVNDFKTLGRAVEGSMEVMRKGFDARIQQCMGHNNLGSFEYCIEPLFGLHKIIRKEYALATAFIIRQYGICLDNHFTPEYCVRNAETKYKELTGEFYQRMNLSQSIAYQSLSQNSMGV
jgi:hypothetical protein